MSYPLRVALFTDSFREANGVATLSRQLTGFARRRGISFLCVLGAEHGQMTRDGSLSVLELPRSPASFPLDQDLYCDPLLTRHKKDVLQELTAFHPDVIHVTGPGDVGCLGVWCAHDLRIPLAASWHTNLHEYLARRIDGYMTLAPRGLRKRATETIERLSLRALLRFYRFAQFTMAPNLAMVDLLHERTGRPAFPIAHGVDLSVFSPGNRCRRNQRFRIGYVGRFTPEKNVRYFAQLENDLTAAGVRDFQLVLVGDGRERAWLQKHLKNVEFTGVLSGKPLAEAFASMDAFVFPSRTDTFGLVLLEAMASGVPVIVSPETGERVGVEHGVTGFRSTNFAQDILRLMETAGLRESMGEAAYAFARGKGWDVVFEQLFETYGLGLAATDVPREHKEQAVHQL